MLFQKGFGSVMLHSPSKEADQVATSTFIGYDSYNASCSPPKVNLRGSRWSSGSSLPLSLGTSFSSPRPTFSPLPLPASPHLGARTRV